MQFHRLIVLIALILNFGRTNGQIFEKLPSEDLQSFYPNPESDTYDFNGDGIEDLLSVCRYKESTLQQQFGIRIFLGRITGEFSEVDLSNLIPENIFDAKVMDIDQDGDLDILTYRSNNQLTLLINTGKAEFTGKEFNLEISDDSVLQSLEELSISKIDLINLYGDNRQELVIGFSGIPTYFLGVFELQSDSTCYLVDQYIMARRDVDFITADFDNNGYNELLIFNRSVSTYNGAQKEVIKFSSDSLINQSIFNEAVSDSDTQVFDIDGDSDLDIVSTQRIFLNNGGGNFSETRNVDFYFKGFVSDITPIDIDGDSDMDELSFGMYQKQVFTNLGHQYFSEIFFTRLYKNDGDGAFKRDTNFTDLDLWNVGYASGDIDLDGDTDIILTGRIGNGSDTSFIFLNNNGALIPDSSNTIDGMRLADLKLIDLDFDGDLDLIASGFLYNNNDRLVTYKYENKTIDCPKDYVVDSIVAYHPVTWLDGKTYSESISGPQFVINNSTGCDSIITLHLTIKEPLSVENIRKIDSQIYPNPVSKTLRIINEDFSGTSEYWIIDISGKKVNHWSSVEPEQEIDISTLKTGSYVLKASNGKRIWIKRFIKSD